MKLSPIILSAAVAASSQYLRGAAPGARRLPEPGPGQPRAAGRGPPQQQGPAELSTEYFLVPGPKGRRQPQRRPEPGPPSSVASVVSVPATGKGGPQRPGQPPAGEEVGRGAPAAHQPLLRQQPWALPLAALSAVAMLLMAAFEIFVLFKARAAAPSRRHLFLGQALLLGLFLLAGLSAAASLTANPVSCAAFRLVGLPAALVFAALLVKCVFLLSLNSGVYLPAPYQALVLVFAVLVQVTIVGQWLYGEPPAVVQSMPPLVMPSLRLDRSHTTMAATSCKTPLGQTVASLGYPCALLLAVTCLAIQARGVRDNYRESAFIGLAVGLALPVWATSAVGSIVAGEPEREAWLAYGLLATAILVFLAMFLPKCRQFAALGREASAGGAVAAATIRADRDERLSSLPGSGYSPSFFHFKPAESSLKRKMHYQSADRVALVSSGIPGCNACRHGGSPVYSDGTSASNFEHMPYIHGPMETFVLPPGMYLSPEDSGNLYTTLSTNPNVFFQRAHPGMMY